MSLVEDLAEEGYDYAEIIEELEDRGYDAEDIAEAMADVGYDWQETLLDAIREHAIDSEGGLDDAAYYADLLDIDVSDVYDIYFGYEDE